MSTKLLLTKNKQSLAKDLKTLSLLKLEKRRLDTPAKIEYGGLVIKSNLSKHNKNIILGGLVYLSDIIDKDSSKKEFFESIGKSKFNKGVE